MVDRRGARSPSPSGTDDERQRQRIALLWLGGLVLAALGLWLIAMLSSQGGGGQPAPDVTVDDGVDPDIVDDPDPGEPGDAGAAAAEEDVEAGSDAEDPNETNGGADDGMASITFDGECTVEVPVGEEAAAGQRRAWEFDECTSAPIAIEGRTERWIVVRASMPAGEFDVAEADERAGELGVDGGVLWSSHYPSLTEGLWVAFDGPFPDADAARDAAEAAGGGAYVRALTAD